MFSPSQWDAKAAVEMAPVRSPKQGTALLDTSETSTPCRLVSEPRQGPAGNPAVDLVTGNEQGVRETRQGDIIF